MQIVVNVSMVALSDVSGVISDNIVIGFFQLTIAISISFIKKK